MGAPEGVDLHQHLWPEALVDRLRARSRPPFMRGRTLFTAGEKPFVMDTRGHVIAQRLAVNEAAGVRLACVSLSAPLGLEYLRRSEAGELLEVWHAAATDLPPGFAPWASVPAVEPDLEGLRVLLRGRFVGVQLPATEVSTPAGWQRVAEVLRVAEEADRPVLVHPGPVVPRPLRGDVPDWWAPVVTYTHQLHAAWWAWHAVVGRRQFPRLRVVFAAGAGLAPLHHERYATRGGTSRPIDSDIFVDTSTHGPQALDALVRALGIDAVVLGSDAPYGAPLTAFGGDAALHAIRVRNPQRALGRATVTSTKDPTKEETWPQVG